MTIQKGARRANGPEHPHQFQSILANLDQLRVVIRVRRLLEVVERLAADTRQVAGIVGGDEGDDLAILAVHLNNLSEIVATDLAWVDAGGQP